MRLPARGTDTQIETRLRLTAPPPRSTIVAMVASKRPRPWAPLPLAVAVGLLSCSPSVTPPPTSPIATRASAPAGSPGSGPLPTKDNELADIACPSPRDCIAVGHIGEG